MESKEPTQEKIIEAVKKYYGLTIDENAYQSADIYAYEETTADGYSVYVVTNDMNSVCIADCTLYADQYFLDDIYFDDALLEAFQEIADQIYDEIMNEDSDYNFDMAELQWLKEEFTESEEINQTVS